MATIKSFEDIEAWKKARKLTNQVYAITKLDSFSKDFDLVRQIRRASGSIMHNIAEGFERDGRKEFIQFLSIAKASTGEVRSQLYIALDQHYIENDVFEKLYNDTTDISKLINGLLRYLKKSDYTGNKYKVEEELAIYSSTLN